ncbi:hypothetical protein WK23_13950 [Burkholderia vietnamiensis]|nr:iron chelate uptake ABC transporter family permease subunit [Burkholderia vietnamiensis]AOJ99637.1 hypothetical protein WK23_13950 [Burkholderia vietnamiensis]
MARCVSLGIAGTLFQSLTRNPLASPDLLGVRGGAQLGLLAAMLVPARRGWSAGWNGSAGRCAAPARRGSTCWCRCRPAPNGERSRATIRSRAC